MRFYYDLSSPYAYLAAHRVDELAPGVEWTPIAFGWVLRATERVPWSLRPGREPQMQEVERRASARGLPPVRWPEGWPAQTYSLNPPRAALVAQEHGRLKDFTLAMYDAHFAHARPLRDPDELAEVAASVGLDPEAVRTGIDRPDVKDRLRANTEEALARGVTGIPTVAIGEELFWGDDRLEDAGAALSASRAR
jgi:2-hydroxychromene-2-carboxylate isomerase